MNFLLQCDGGPDVAELQVALREKEAAIQRLKEELKASTARQGDTVTQVSPQGILHPFLVSNNHPSLLERWLFLRFVVSSFSKE